VVGAIITRVESPLVRSAGVLAGLAAGLRAVRGSNKGREREVIIERDTKRRGPLGRKK
jgi:hypothetical protein